MKKKARSIGQADILNAIEAATKLAADQVADMGGEDIDGVSGGILINNELPPIIFGLINPDPYEG